MTNEEAVAQEIAPGLESVEHAEPNYIAVFVYLTVLTGVEVIVAYAGLPKMAMVSLLVALAWAKAALVAMYFMHLAIERRGLIVIAVAPVVLVTFLLFMLMPDLTSRIWAGVNHHVQVTAPVAESAPSAPSS